MELADLYKRRDEFFLKPSKATESLIIVGLIVGLLGVAFGFYQDPARGWGVLLTSNMFFFFLAFGGVIFGGIQDVVGAEWGRPIKRMHETFGAFFVPSALFFIAFLVFVKLGVPGTREVYKWIANPAMLDHFPGKNVWLTETFFIVRNIVALVLMIVMVRWSRKQNTLADDAFLAGDLEKAKELGELGKNRLRFWTAPMLFAHGTIFTFLVTDLTMSLSPLWFSTLWGGWSFAVLMQSLLAMMLVFMFLLKKQSMASLVTRSQYHDVGKMLHGFTAFWGYLTFAHILTYWYGNIPEETEYFIHRLHSPWQELMIAVGFMAFVIPFFVLIPKASKWTQPITLPLAFLILSAQWLVHMLVVQPEVVASDKFGFPLAEIGGLVFFASVFVFCFVWVGKKKLLVSLADPLLLKHLNERDHH